MGVDFVEIRIFEINSFVFIYSNKQQVLTPGGY